MVIKKLYSCIYRWYTAYKFAKIRWKHGFSARIILTTSLGYQLDLRFNDLLARDLLLKNQFEPMVSAALFAIVRPGMTVVDVGANIGIHTLHLAELVGASGKVVAAEPNATAIQELHRNLALNNVTNVRVLSCALWEEDGEAWFNYPTEGREAMGGLMSNSRSRVSHKSKIRTARMDSILPHMGIQKVDFIKIDVEGAELPVLKGALRFLESERKPSILYESNPQNTAPYGYTPSDIRGFLTHRAYAVQKLDGENYLAVARP